MFKVSREAFQMMVQEAVEGLPDELRTRMSNVAVVVKDHPSPAELRKASGGDGDSAEDLFGLYQGIPLTERDSRYGMVLPDLITIFQSIHEQECDSSEELREEVRLTVRHEIAHHFGIDDDRLEELGTY